jgi:hypothetical protein
MLGYRAAAQASTKFSPFRLFYGREALLPTERFQEVTALLQRASQEASPPDPEVQGLLAAEPQREEQHAAAKDNIQQAQERQKKDYDSRHAKKKRKRPPPTYQPGDLVSIANYRKKGPMEAALLGPYTFIGYGAKEDGAPATHAVLQDRKKRQWQEPLLRTQPYEAPQPASESPEEAETTTEEQPETPRIVANRAKRVSSFLPILPRI